MSSLGADNDSEQESCGSFTAHPIRKHCKDCQKPWEDHPFTEDDVDSMRAHLKVFSEHPEVKQHTVYAWTPPNCPEDRIDEYFQKFPEDKIPKHQSEGQKNRLRRLAYQVPLSDVSLEKCRFLDPKYQEDFEGYAQKVRDTILRIGQVKEMTQGMPVQCPKCLLVLEPGELVVTSDNGSQAFHPACFVCFQCREFLADLIHCCDTDGLVYCLRHYSENTKKRCHACDELIFSSKFALAGNKSYHKEHLLCFTCDSSLEDAKGYTKNGELYCANCYETNFCTDCINCQKKINVESRHISFRDNNWHEECFSCTKCDTKLSDIPFELVDDDKFLCFECYQKYYAPKCEGCKECFEPQSQVVTYEEKVYHVPCFKCVDCLYSIGTGPFVPHDGQVYCKSCHLRNFGVRCFRCKYAITDDSALMYNKEPYHNACFTCCMCETRLSRRPFKTIEDKWYCFNCYGNTFCQKCHLCEEPIVLGSEEDVMFSYQNYRWHDSCFMCSLCCKSLADKPFTMNEKVLVCKQCITKHEEREKEDREKEERENEEREKLQKEKEQEEKEISSAEDKVAEEIPKAENKEE